MNRDQIEMKKDRWPSDYVTRRQEYWADELGLEVSRWALVAAADYDQVM